MAYFERGNAKANLNQHIAAISDYDITVQYEVNFADAYYNRGMVKNRIDEYISAIIDFDKEFILNLKSKCLPIPRSGKGSA